MISVRAGGRVAAEEAVEVEVEVGRIDVMPSFVSSGSRDAGMTKVEAQGSNMQCVGSWCAFVP
jgi:hypothetical protein